MHHAKFPMSHIGDNRGADTHDGDCRYPCPYAERRVYDRYDDDCRSDCHDEISKGIKLASQLGHRVAGAGDDSVGDIGDAAQRIHDEEFPAEGREQKKREGKRYAHAREYVGNVFQSFTLLRLDLLICGFVWRSADNQMIHLRAMIP